MVNEKLRKLLEDDELDWDNPRHRDMYFRAWVKGELPEEEKVTWHKVAGPSSGSVTAVVRPPA